MIDYSECVGNNSRAEKGDSVEQGIDVGKKVNFTTNIELSAGCHIVYTYTDLNHYLENTLSYITEGLDKDQIVIYIDKPDRYKYIMEKLKHANYSEEQLNEIIFADTDDFYETHDVFNMNQVMANFMDILEPHLKDRVIRTWGFVTWKEQNQNSLMARLKLYECGCDSFVSELENFISVCAYDGFTLPSSILCEILQAHEYHMTDTHLTTSNLYKKKPVLFPAISEQIKLEKAAQDQVIRSEKLSIAGELAAGIAHEIRNPITAIKGFLKLIEVTEDKNKKFLHIISEEIEKIAQISSEFLILSKPHVENKKEINVVDLIMSVQLLLEPQAVKKNIGIQLEYEYSDILITCDDMKIKQVLINLIKNSIEAMEKGFIKVTARDLTDHVHIYVADEGPGIPKEILDNLGQPFFTTKEEGTGLGLLICEKIIEDHNGKIIVESEMGKGTIVILRIPKGQI